MRENAENPIGSRDESHERDLNRHRGDEQRRARAEMVERLADRQIDVSDAESLESVVQALDAIESFEHAVEASGGDLMVDTPPANQPDNPSFVLPRREPGESLDSYASRVRGAMPRARPRRAD